MERRFTFLVFPMVLKLVGVCVEIQMFLCFNELDLLFTLLSLICFKTPMAETNGFVVSRDLFC